MPIKKEAEKTAKKTVRKEERIPFPVKDYSKLERVQLESPRTQRSSRNAGSGCLTIINHSKCGVRLHVSNMIWRELDCPRYMKPLLIDGDLILMSGMSDDVAVKFDHTMDFEAAIENYRRKIVLYASNTVKALVDEWHLEQMVGCCFTCGEYSIAELDGKKVVAIAFSHDSGEEGNLNETDTVEIEEAEETDFAEEAEEVEENNIEEDRETVEDTEELDWFEELFDSEEEK